MSGQDYNVRKVADALKAEVGRKLERVKMMYEKGVNGLNTRYSDDFLNWYQTIGVETFYKSKKLIIADEMGLGKTAQAVAGKLEIENRSGKRAKTLVVIPNTLKEQWYDRIQEYCDRKQTTVVLDNYKEKDLKEVKDSDFVIVNFDVFGTNGTGNRLTASLMENKFDYVILDEAHNVKNGKALSSANIKKIADSVEYLCMLSGTPIPNDMTDTYMMISLLDPERYPTWKDVMMRYRYDADAIGSVLRANKIKRSLKDVIGLPPLRQNIESTSGVLELSPEQREVYKAVLENDFLEGTKKLQELRKALLDPSLVDPRVVFDPVLREKLTSIPSTKYRELERVVKEKTENGEKVVIFSPLFMTGVTEKLERTLKDYGVVRIDGSVPNKERAGKIKDFKSDPYKKVFIGTTATTGEGIDDLTTASCVIFLDETYTTAERNQAIARVYRPGQKKEVNVISLAAKDSVDEGVLELLGWKEKLVKILEDGEERLSDEDMRDFRHGYAAHRFIRSRMYTPQQEYAIQAGQMVDKGSEIINRNRDKLKAFADNYLMNWDLSYQGNTALACRDIVRALSKGANLSRKIDLGSGPGALSHVLNEPTVNVDILPWHFEKKGFAHPDSKNIVGSFHDLKKELADESFDLAVMSLSFHDTSPRFMEGERSEREQAVREANRILRKDGYIVVALPRSRVDPVTSLGLMKSFSKMGFEPVPEMIGPVRDGSGETDFEVYMSVYKKLGNPSDESVSGDLKLMRAKNRNEYSMKRKGVGSRFDYVRFSLNGPASKEPVSSNHASVVEVS